MARLVGARVSERLTKAEVLAALQCRRRAWLAVRDPALGAPLSPSRQALREAGRAVARLAHAILPSAVRVDESEFGAAAARTAALLAGSAPAIIDAAVAHDGIAIRADVLERLPDGTWRLCEIKAGTRVREVHLDDLAVQRHVLTGAGFAIAAVEVLHVDAEYVRDTEVDHTRLFVRRDVAADVEARAATVRDRIAALRGDLAVAAPPVVEPSPHCSTPYRCEFWGHCTRMKPADWVLHFGYVRAEQWEALAAAGTIRLGELTEASGVPPTLLRARDALTRGGAVVAPGLSAALREFGPPADYLDFETMSPAVPLYAGTGPYARLPFQWSLHRRDARGITTHREFLAAGRGDPRRGFAESLLACAEETAHPILVYSAFESEVLAEVAAALPDLAPRIETVRTRLRDLLPMVRSHVYHPDFHGSFSLKAVAPALAPGFGYTDLEAIADGADATVQLARIAAGECTAEEETTLRAALRAYCARDTEALVRLHDALLALADG